MTNLLHLLELGDWLMRRSFPALTSRCVFWSTRILGLEQHRQQDLRSHQCVWRLLCNLALKDNYRPCDLKQKSLWWVSEPSTREAYHCQISCWCIQQLARWHRWFVCFSFQLRVAFFQTLQVKIIEIRNQHYFESQLFESRARQMNLKATVFVSRQIR